MESDSSSSWPVCLVAQAENTSAWPVSVGEGVFRRIRGSEWCLGTLALCNDAASGKARRFTSPNLHDPTPNVGIDGYKLFAAGAKIIKNCSNHK